MHACEILPRILIDNPDCFKHTLNSNVDAYHGKLAFMLSSVLELLPNFKSTYFASVHPPNMFQSYPSSCAISIVVFEAVTDY